MMSAHAARRAFLCDLARLSGSVAGLGVLAGCAQIGSPAVQPSARVYRVGLLASSTTSPDAAPRGLWERLGALGYVEGQNLAKEERLSDGNVPAQIRDFAAELARLPVDVIVATNPPTVRAAAGATSTIPIVMMGTNISVESGFVESLARPSGNVTGVTGGGSGTPDLVLKRLQLLVEAAPAVSRIGLLVSPAPLPAGWGAATRSLGVGYLEMGSELARDDFEPAFARAAAEGVDAVLVVAGTQYVANADLIVALAARHGLPAMHFNRGFVTGGGLMAYTARASEIERRAAEYVDRILRGARPADLPVERATGYDLVVNFRTARSLGLNLSRDFLARVDEMIE